MGSSRENLPRGGEGRTPVRPVEREAGFEKDSVERAAAGETLERQAVEIPIELLGGGAFEPGIQSLSIPANVVDALLDLSRREGVPLSESLLAAFQTLLHRYTSQEEIAVGVPGAPIREATSSHGSFRIARREFGDDPSFRELLARGRTEPGGGSTPSPSPFKLGPSSPPGVKPEFSRLGPVFFGLGEESERWPEKFDLALRWTEDPEGEQSALLYDRERFEETTIRRFAGHFLTLLEACAATPDERVSTLPLVTPAERRELLFEWNRTEAEYTREKTVHALFQEQVERTPDAVAVVFGRERLTYGELNRRANQLARFLRRQGVGPEVLVGVCLDRSLELVVGILGIVKAGGAYVPLDPTYPADRLAFLIEDSGVGIVLTQRHLASRCSSGASLVSLDTDWPTIGQESGEGGASGATPENLLYVIYTSGSTGRPKGVLVTHYNVVRLLQATEPWFGFGKSDVWTLFHSSAFDFSVWEFWGALAYGGRLIVVPYLVSRSPDEFYKLLSEERVTVLNQTPSAFRQLIQAEEESAVQRSLDLRVVIFGGEALEISSLRPWFVRHGDRSPQLVNMYGITETTVHVTYRPLGSADLSAPGSRIGRPIPDLRVYLLDAHLHPIPVGVPGEMYVGGSGVARGYLNRPELTEERFLSDPFRSDGARMYRTGDRARFLPDGDIQFLGRVDDQVKIRGYRIEIGEIEQALARRPEIQACVVAAQEEPSGDKRLIGYVVPRNDASLSVTQLREFLKTTLPDHMVPSAFVFLDALPLTPNGKVDRRALPAPGPERPELEKPFVAPRDRWEQELARIWEKVFRIDRVGVYDDFFELGGHSIVAGRLFAEIRRSFGKELPPTTLLRAPTIDQLAPFLKGEQESQRWTSLVPIQLGGSRPPLFCIHAGAGTILYYHDLARVLGPEQPIYGLQAQGLYGEVPPHGEVEEMAAHYVREMRTVQPEGPYYLAGLCFGGVLAFAVAERLRREKSEVALLASFDGGSHRFDYAVKTGGGMSLDGPREGTARYWISLQRQRLRRVKPAERVAYLARKAKNRLRLWKKAARARGHLALGDFLRRRGRPLPEALRHTYFRANAKRASRRYAPKPYPGPMVIFESRGAFRDPHLGWDGLVTGGLEIHEIPIATWEPGRYHAAFISAVGEPLRERLLVASAPSTPTDIGNHDPAGMTSAERA